MSIKIMIGRKKKIKVISLYLWFYEFTEDNRSKICNTHLVFNTVSSPLSKHKQYQIFHIAYFNVNSSIPR